MQLFFRVALRFIKKMPLKQGTGTYGYEYSKDALLADIKKMPLKQGTETGAVDCAKLSSLPIKKMPLKQGTETSSLFILFTS